MHYPPLLLSLFASVAACSFAASDYRVTVPAFEKDRAGVVVTVPLPADAPSHPVLRDARGEIVPLQPGPLGQAVFVLPYQSAGTALTYTLVSGTHEPEAITAQASEKRLDVAQEGELAFRYWMEPEPLPRAEIDPIFLRNAFIHPVMTPAGVAVTDSYPKDHLHHHGIWAPWTKTRFQGRTPDFWNMGQRTGTVEFVALDERWSGPVHAGFVARHRFVDTSAPEPVVALNETWEVTAYHVRHGDKPARIFDLVTTQTCATNDPLILPEYHYGGLGFRGRAEWNGRENARFLTSEGLTDREKAHGTRARWCHVGGKVDGNFVGTAIMDHPTNFRSPQPMRIHPNEPFFCYAPSQLGEWQITPGEPYVARYRFVVMDGEPDPALLEAYWNGYASPATATVARR